VRFLQQLDSSDEFFFRAIDLNEERPPRPLWAQSLTDCIFDRLEAWNNEGFEIFVAVKRARQNRVAKDNCIDPNPRIPRRQGQWFNRRKARLDIAAIRDRANHRLDRSR
jgi:hypothetical protein